MTKIIDQYNLSPSDLLTTLREVWIPSVMPNLDSQGIRGVIIDIAKVFIWTAESSLGYGVGILNSAAGSNLLSDDDLSMLQNEPHIPKN